MKIDMKLLLSLFVFIIVSVQTKAQTIEFPSSDGIMITADSYIKHDLSAPFILLFHQAGWSRGEYVEIAPKLNAMGYNCIAIDQRSGDEVNDIINVTHQNAENKQLEVGFPDALPDMKAAIAYVKEHYVKGKLILWGSSYSSALVLKLLGDEPNICDAGLSFAPGEYFERFGKTNDFIITSAKNIQVPIFITSAKDEKEYWWPIYQSINTTTKQYFLPESDGNHGSRALWEKFDDHDVYWTAVKKYLKSIK